ncbi:Uncharacterised protein [Sphingobacterium daejeonense]|nr:Uncharacterised protein [Sphingobacterium daejeonense]
MNDAMIGLVEGFEFWVDRDLFEYWKFSHFTLGCIGWIRPRRLFIGNPNGENIQNSLPIIYR